MPWIIAAVSLLVLTLGVSLAVYFAAFYNKNDADVTYRVLTGEGYDVFHDEMISLIDSAVRIPYEEAFAASYDGLRLFGRIYMQKEGAPFHIQFNGYKGNGVRDFSGGLHLALSLGENVLLVDQRAHGRSEGHTISFGIKERRDVLTWINFILEKYGEKTDIYLEGVSMGAATVLMACDLPLPENVRGIVADCPFSSPFGIVRKVGREMTRLDYVTFPFIFLAALVFGRFNILSSDAVRSVRNAKKPVLLIHGTADRFVPIRMSHEIRAANPDLITFIEVEGAPHGLSLLKDREGYRRAFTEFIEKIRSEET